MIRLDIAEETILDQPVGIDQFVLAIFLETVKNLDQNGTDGRI